MMSSPRLIKVPLPDEVDTPSFLKFDPSAFPIMQLSMVKDGKENGQLKDDVERVTQTLSQLPGVASADYSGLLDKQVLVTLDGEEMKKYGLSQSNIRERIEASNVSQPGGIIQKGSNDLPSRAISELTSIKAFRDLHVGVNPKTGDEISLADVAEVKLGKKERSVITRTNGKPGVGINIFKQSGANTAEVSKEVRAELKRLNKTVDADTLIIFDQGKYVDRTVKNVSSTMVGGGILAMLVLFLFLRSLRSPLIIGVAIPVSVITAFVLMYLADFSLNIMTLGGLALGVGMLVDNAIVVIENIYRHLQMGEEPKEAATNGAGEVAVAITASTLTTIFVFVPIMFVSGIVGQLFKEFAFTVTFSLLASLLISLTLVPVMAAKIMKKPQTRWAKEREQSFLYCGFRKTLKWSLAHRFTVALIALVLLVTGLVGIRSVGTEYLPAADEGIFIAELKMPPGTSLKKTKQVSAKVEKILDQEKDIKNFQATMGTANNENSLFGDSGRNIAQIYVNVVDKSERNRSTRAIMDDLRPQLTKVDPKVEIDLREQSSFEAAGAPDTLEFTVSGKKKELEKWTDKITAEIQKLDYVQQVSDSEKETKPELTVSVDRKKAEDKGVAPAQVIAAVSDATRGQVVTRANVKGDSYDVFLRFEDQFRQSPDQLKDLPIQAGVQAVEMIPLSDLATLKVEDGPITINRSNLQDSIEYKVQYHGTDLGTVEKEVMEKLDQLLPPELNVELKGSAELFRDSFDDLILAIGLAVLFIFLVLAAQFESFKYPFVIMLTLPLMVIGVTIALFVTQTPVGVTAMIGLIVLAGIVVNNAIVLVDTINQLKAKGISSYDAIVEAGMTRLRPILMTATTTVLGLIPLSLGLGEGAEIQQPIGIAVIGGLFSSTLLTLVVIPVVYSWFDSDTRRMKISD